MPLEHIGESAQRVLRSVVRQRLAGHMHSVPATKIPIKAIWRMRAKDREAVARNIQRYTNERI